MQATLSAVVDPTREASSVPTDLLLTLRDVSGERSVQPTLRDHTEDDAHMAEAAQQHLQMFADSVAHDLRAPLRSIESFAGRSSTNEIVRPSTRLRTPRDDGLILTLRISPGTTTSTVTLPVKSKCE